MAIHQLAGLADVLHNKVEFGTIEHVENFVQADVDGLLQELRVEQVLNLEGDIAKYHGQGKVLESSSALCRLAPLAFGIVSLSKHDVEGLLGDVGIFLNACCFVELSKSNHGEGVGEDVVGLHKRTALSVKREVPVQLAVVPVLLEELGALNSRIEPFLLFLYLII